MTAADLTGYRFADQPLSASRPPAAFPSLLAPQFRNAFIGPEGRAAG